MDCNAFLHLRTITCARFTLHFVTLRDNFDDASIYLYLISTSESVNLDDTTGQVGQGTTVKYSCLFGIERESRQERIRQTIPQNFHLHREAQLDGPLGLGPSFNMTRGTRFAEVPLSRITLCSSPATASAACTLGSCSGSPSGTGLLASVDRVTSLPSGLRRGLPLV